VESIIFTIFFPATIVLVSDNSDVETHTSNQYLLIDERPCHGWVGMDHVVHGHGRQFVSAFLVASQATIINYITWKLTEKNTNIKMEDSMDGLTHHNNKA